MTKVTFEVHVVHDNDLEEIAEETLTSNFEQYRELLLQQDVLEGAIVIEAQDQAPVQIVDELNVAVQNLCFGAIPALLEEKRESYIYRYMSWDGHLVMIPLANVVRLVGEDMPAVTEKIDALLPALYQCGERYIEFLQRLGNAHHASIEYLRPFADKAKSILGKHNLL